MANVAKQRLTYAEYVAAEDASDTKHEYVGGLVLAMAGGTIEHGRLMGRFGVLLETALGVRPCVILPSDVRVRIRAAERATYPDLYVVCGRIERDPEDERAVINPTVIVEVLSDSTAESDRSEKFADYRRLPSLREYVLVSQRQRRIEVFRRDPAPRRRWVLEEYATGESLRLESIDVAFAVDDVYADRLGVIVP